MQYTWSGKTNIRNTLHNTNSHMYKMISLNLKFTTNKYLTKTCRGLLHGLLQNYSPGTTVAYKTIKISEKEQLVDFVILLADPRDWN